MKSVRPKVDEEKELDSVPLPWDFAQYWEHVLKALSNPMNNVKDLSATFSVIMEKKLATSTLDLAIEAMNDPQLFSTTLPFIVQLVKNSPKIISKIPYLNSQTNSTLKLSREQCACIMANAFFGTFLRPTPEPYWKLFASINLDGLYESYNNLQPRIGKMLMILNYFSRICKKMPQGFVEFRRQCVAEEPNWTNSQKPLVQVTVDESGSIEDYPHALQADFANAFIGGAAISYGCVQEEIRFAICPELIVSRLFCPIMQHNEAIIITGAEQFSKYKGYGGTLGFGGDYVDPNIDAQGNCTVAV